MAPFIDLCVVGAGPAGSAAAITAARAGVKVLLLDKDSFPRHKVCGEFVSFESLALLRDLIGDQISGVPIDRVRLLRGESLQEGRLPHPALSVSRFALDERLVASAIDAGVQVMTGCRVKTISNTGSGFSVATSNATYFARAVINATGRWSEFNVARRLPSKPLIGIKQHFHEASPHPSTGLYFFAGGYCGVQPVGDDLINVSALVQPSSARSLQQIVELSAALRARAQRWTPATDEITTAPIDFGPPRPVSEGMLNVGDAAAFIDPFLGDGISIALQTGVLAGTLALRTDGLKSYERKYLRRIAPAFRRASRLRRWSGSALAWQAMRLPGMLTLAARVTRVRAA